MIISEAQRAAARLNGAKSRGPKTEAGKRCSSRNGCKHNLPHWWLRLPDAFATNGGIHQYSRSHSFLAPGESSDDFARLLEELRAIYQPQNPKAESALHIFAANTWLQNRVRRTEISLTNAEMDHLAPFHLGGHHCQTHSAAYGGIHQNPDADFHTFAFLACECVPIDLLGRCEWRYERRINRAEDILDKEKQKTQTPIRGPGPHRNH